MVPTKFGVAGVSRQIWVDPGWTRRFCEDLGSPGQRMVPVRTVVRREVAAGRLKKASRTANPALFQIFRCRIRPGCAWRSCKGPG